MKKTIYILFILNLLLPISAFSQDSVAVKIISEIQEKFAPDRRVTVYNVKPVIRDGKIVIKGEISDNNNYKELLKLLKTNAVNYVDSIKLLPDATEIGDKCWAIVPLSVIYMRKYPSYDSEVISQTIMGTPVKMLDKAEDGWTLIQTPDGYLGWTDTHLDGMTLADRTTYNAQSKLIVTVNNAMVYQEPKEKSGNVADVVLCNLMIYNDKLPNKGYYEVTLPDGRKGYISEKSVELFSKWKDNIHLTGENLTKQGENFIGLPYVWGGTSSRGMDCSGFTKTIYSLNGVILPRDASQQYLVGEKVDTNHGFDNLKKGDLLFFGKKNKKDPNKPRIIHVAMYLGNYEFIHSSNTIHISSLDPKSPIFDKYNLNRFIGAKRYIGVPVEGFWNIFTHEWYQ